VSRKKAEEEAAAAAAAEAGSEASGDEGQQSDDHSGGEHEEISLAFDTFGPAQEDCEGIEGCVAGMLDGREFDCRGLTELIIRQAVELGMVVKIVGEDEVYGVMSVADMSQSSVASLREIGDFIVDKCPESSRALFESAVKGKTGLVINERPTGTPPGLALPLLTSLLDEIKEAQTGQYKVISPIRPPSSPLHSQPSSTRPAPHPACPRLHPSPHPPGALATCGAGSVHPATCRLLRLLLSLLGAETSKCNALS